MKRIASFCLPRQENLLQSAWQNMSESSDSGRPRLADHNHDRRKEWEHQPRNIHKIALSDGRSMDLLGLFAQSSRHRIAFVRPWHWHLGECGRRRYQLLESSPHL